MLSQEVEVYVAAVSAFLGISLDSPQQSSVAAHLSRTLVMAELLEKFPLPLTTEPVGGFSPAPFPHVDPYGADANE